MLNISRQCIFAALLATPLGVIHAEEAPITPIAPSTSAFVDASDRIHAGMDIDYTGNADVDFVRGMIPHHMGAIDMANIVLKYGKDPEVKRMANDVIAMQTTEIKQMQAWLDTHAHKSAIDNAPQSIKPGAK